MASLGGSEGHGNFSSTPQVALWEAAVDSAYQQQASSSLRALLATPGPGKFESSSESVARTTTTVNELPLEMVQLVLAALVSAAPPQHPQLPLPLTSSAAAAVARTVSILGVPTDPGGLCC